MLLAGDVGGTKTSLAIISPERDPRNPLAETTVTSGGHPSLAAAVQPFLDSVPHRVTRAALGIAGPVVDGRVTATNLPWQVDAAALERELGLEQVWLLNDLQALAYSVPLLDGDELVTLRSGSPDARGAIAIIAPGTGLGEAFLVWDGTRYRAYPSEGGHCDFAPANDLQADLYRYLAAQYGHVSNERVCSGRGMPNLYAFLKDRGHAPEPDWLRDEVADASDPTPIIVDRALEAAPGADLCVATLDLFVDILAAEAGNLALKIVSTGGIYLGGGIPPRILPKLQSEGFLRRIDAKGRLLSLLEGMPVHIVLNPRAALLGAASFGLSQMKENK